MSFYSTLETARRCDLTVVPSKPVNAYILQVIVLANHMNGKDTHVRGLRVLGPLEYVFFHAFLWRALTG